MPASPDTEPEGRPMTLLLWVSLIVAAVLAVAGPVLVLTGRDDE